MAETAGAAPDLETASARYARRFSGPVGAWFLDVQAGAVLDLLADLGRARLLEVGGGHGQLTGHLLEAGHDVTVYGSPGACGESLRPWVAAGRVRFEEGDLLRAPWPDRSFDGVLAVRLLPHLERWRDLLGELCRLAGRLVVVDYPTARSVNAAAGALAGLKRAVEADTRPFRVFRDRELRAAFRAHGFTVTGRRPQFFLPMVLHRALRSAALGRALERAAGAVGLTRALGSPVVARAERDGRS